MNAELEDLFQEIDKFENRKDIPEYKLDCIFPAAIKRLHTPYFISELLWNFAPNSQALKWYDKLVERIDLLKTIHSILIIDEFKNQKLLAIFPIRRGNFLIVELSIKAHLVIIWLFEGNIEAFIVPEAVIHTIPISFDLKTFRQIYITLIRQGVINIEG